MRTILIEETGQGTIFTGEIFYAEPSAITDHGFICKTHHDAVTNTAKSYEKSLGPRSGKGRFSVAITNDLTKNTQYTLQAYATNGQYTAYGAEIKFTSKNGGLTP